MLAIRLQRIGKKHSPSFRLVVAERRSKMAAPPTEDLGSFNPFTKKFEVKQEKIEHWIKVGAKPTVTVHNLLVNAGILKSPKMAVKMKKFIPPAAGPESKPADAAAPAAVVAEEMKEAPAEESKPAEAPAA